MKIVKVLFIVLCLLVLAGCDEPSSTTTFSDKNSNNSVEKSTPVEVSGRFVLEYKETVESGVLKIYKDTQTDERYLILDECTGVGGILLMR